MNPETLHIDYPRLLHKVLLLEERIAVLEAKHEPNGKHKPDPCAYVILNEDAPDPMERITSEE